MSSVLNFLLSVKSIVSSARGVNSLPRRSLASTAAWHRSGFASTSRLLPLRLFWHWSALRLGALTLPGRYAICAH